jgi:hypothetical protein
VSAITKLKATALEILDRHGLQETLARRSGLERELRALGAPHDWNGGGAFSPIGPAESSQRAIQLAAELEQLTQRSYQQLQAAAAEHAPLAMALSVAHLRSRFLREPIGVGGKVPRDFRAAAQELFDRIAAIWAPDTDEEQLVRLLSDRAQLQALATGAPAVEEHPQLGYAPASFQTIARIAATALLPKYDQLLAIGHKEDAEWRARAQELRAERKKQGLLAGDEPLMPLQVAVAREQHEAMAAIESLYESVDTAVDAFPPFRIRTALRPLLPELNLPTTVREFVLNPATGQLVSLPSLSTRILLGHALARLVRITNEVFPGLLGLINAPEQASRANERAKSPFREAQAEQDVPTLSSEGELFADLDKAAVFRSLDQSLMHASVLGRLKLAEPKAKARVKVVDILNVFQQSPEQQVEAGLRERRNWHAEVLLTLTAAAPGHVHQYARHYLPLELHRLVCALHDAAGVVRARLVDYDPHFGFSKPKATVDYLGTLLSALSILTNTVGRSTGLSGSALQLAERVANALRTGDAGSPFPGTSNLLHYDRLVRCLAFNFRSQSGTRFAEQVERYGALIAYAQQNASRSQQADAAVTLFDRINVFTDSPAEAARDQSAAASKHQHWEAQQLFSHIHQELDVALRAYPPGRAFFSIDAMRIAAESIHAVAVNTSAMRNHRYWRAVLVGREQFVSALYQWNHRTMRDFCAIVSPAQVLERYTLRSLTEAS